MSPTPTAPSYGRFKVFCIDDGEQHWFVAEHSGAALARMCELDMEPEPLSTDPYGEVTLRLLAAADPFTITFPVDDVPRELPADAVVEPRPDTNAVRVRATCAAWAATFDRAGFLASTVF